MRKLILIAGAGGLILQTIGCSPATAPVPTGPEVKNVAAAADSTGPRLSPGPGGTLILSWMEPDTGGTSLRYSEYRDGGWSDPRLVVAGEDMFVNWADLPSVVPLGGQHLAAHWLSQKPDSVYSYDVTFSQSMDGGTTWSTPVIPHDDNTPTEHGFVSIFPIKQRAGLIWLDGRKMVNDYTDDPVDTGMTLRTAMIDKQQQLSGAQLIDELICDCCQTDVAIAASGPVAVYRDRSIDEIRDISVTRYIDEQWQAGRTVSSDNWEIAGCPVNGPAIAAQENSVAVAWFTAADNAPVVKVASSQDGGVTFSPVQEVASGSTLGRVGVTMLDDGDAAVSWLQPGENGSAVVMVRKIRDSVTLGPPITVSSSASSFSVPQLARSGDDLIFAWSETRDGIDRVSSARIAIKSLD